MATQRGVALYASIVTALSHRERTGEGGLVHMSLLGWLNGLWSAAGIAQGALAGADMAEYRDNNLVNGMTMRLLLALRASDGRWLRNEHGSRMRKYIAITCSFRRNRFTRRSAL